MVQDRDIRISDLETHAKNLEEVLQDRDIRIGDLETHTGNLKRELLDREDTLHAIYTSSGWKLLSHYYRIRDRLLPANSARRKAIKFIWNLRKRRPDDALRLLKTDNSFPPDGTGDAAPPEAKIRPGIARNSRLNSQFWRSERPLKNRCLEDAGELAADKRALAEIITKIKDEMIESFERGEHRE